MVNCDMVANLFANLFLLCIQRNSKQNSKVVLSKRSCLLLAENKRVYNIIRKKITYFKTINIYLLINLN